MWHIVLCCTQWPFRCVVSMPKYRLCSPFHCWAQTEIHLIEGQPCFWYVVPNKSLCRNILCRDESGPPCCYTLWEERNWGMLWQLWRFVGRETEGNEKRFLILEWKYINTQTDTCCSGSQDAEKQVPSRILQELDDDDIRKEESVPCSSLGDQASHFAFSKRAD